MLFESSFVFGLTKSTYDLLRKEIIGSIDFNKMMLLSLLSKETDICQTFSTVAYDKAKKTLVNNLKHLHNILDGFDYYVNGCVDKKGEKIMVTPLFDKVVVEVLQEEVEDNGIILPDSAKEKPNVGRVMAVGKGKCYGSTFVPTTVQAGDKIIFNRTAGFPQKIDGREYLIIAESDAIAII